MEEHRSLKRQHEGCRRLERSGRQSGMAALGEGMRKRIQEALNQSSVSPGCLPWPE